jgi:hypothetical protein
MTPKVWCPNMLNKVSYNWPYSHEKWQEEEFTEDAQNWAQVLERKATPGLTIFKTLSLDQQMEVLTQELLLKGKQKRLEEMKKSMIEGRSRTTRPSKKSITRHFVNKSFNARLKRSCGKNVKKRLLKKRSIKKKRSRGGTKKKALEEQ